MAIFDDIKLKWQGVEYTIPSNRVLGAIARIEEIITIPELLRFEARQTIPLVKLSQAFASVLRYTGAKVTDEEIFEGMFRKTEDSAAEIQAVRTLITMMVPKSVATRATEAGAVGKSIEAAKASSSKRSKHSLVSVDAFPRENSGN